MKWNLLQSQNLQRNHFPARFGLFRETDHKAFDRRMDAEQFDHGLFRIGNHKGALFGRLQTLAVPDFRKRGLRIKQILLSFYQLSNVP